MIGEGQLSPLQQRPNDQKFKHENCDHLVAAGGGKSCYPPITRVAHYKHNVDLLPVDLLPVELITE